MLSLLSKGLLVTLAVLLVSLLVVLLVDEKSTSTAVSACRIRPGTSVAVRIIYHSTFARLLRFLTGGQLYAITIWHRIYVAGSFLTKDNLVHELEHVRQWHVRGPFVFTVDYLYQLMRFGYLHAPYEIAAREAAGQTPWLR